MAEKTDLSACRKKIDAIDHEILRLFQVRMAVAAEVARCKAEAGLPVRNPAREAEILTRVAEETEPEYAEAAKRLFATLFELSRDFQTRLLEAGKDR